MYKRQVSNESVFSIVRRGTPAASGTISFTGTGLITDVPSGGYHGLIVKNNGTEHFRIQSTGRVGIGTASPATILDIQNPGDSAYTGGLLIRTGTSTSEATSLYHDNNSATTSVLANRYDNAGGAIKLILRASSASPVTALTALGSGNVGIGTTLSLIHI